MDKYQETFNTWNKVAEAYQSMFMDLELYNDTYDSFIKKLTKDDSSILEIGCGPGNISKYLLSKKPQLKIKGIDISENMIQLAKVNNPLVEFEVMDSRFINQIDKKFDAIICGFCIPYLSHSDLLKLISDCENLLHESGILYLSFIEGEYKKSGFITGSKGDRAYLYYYNLINIEKELKDRSFEKIELFEKIYEKSKNENEVHNIIILKKRTHNTG